MTQMRPVLCAIASAEVADPDAIAGGNNLRSRRHL